LRGGGGLGFFLWRDAKWCDLVLF